MTTVQKLTRHDVFTRGMGNGVAAPMQMEIVEGDACDPSDEFIARGENFDKF